MKLDPARLRRLMEHDGRKQVEIAKQVKCTPKTIGRWLKGEVNPPPRTIIKLSKVLGVDAEVLAGQAPMPELRPSKAVAPKTRLGADVSARTRNAFMLVGETYGITQTQIIEMAPLLFTLLAEGSLDYRRVELAKDDARIAEMNAAANGYRCYLSSHWAEEGALEEQGSIDQSDIFGLQIDGVASELGYYQPTDNPFFEYLTHLATHFTNTNAVLLDIVEDLHADGIPAFSLFNDRLLKIAGGDQDLARHISIGTVDLAKIPPEFKSPEKQEERIKWMKAEVQRIQDAASDFLAELANSGAKL